MRDIVQIAGIVDETEARMLVECGVDYLGFPLRLPVHREDLSEPEAAEIIRSLSDSVRPVAITYLDEATEVVALCRDLGLSTVQLHGDISGRQLNRIKAINPSLMVIKGLTIREDNVEALRDAVAEMSPLVDAFITDSFDPATGASGATGITHDWRISRMIVDHSPRPVILAGGLNPDNVGGAILEVRPAGVDAHTGVEGKDGRKDRARVANLVKAARKAFASL